MKERDNNRFYDTTALTETKGLRARANATFIEAELKKRLPGESIRVTTVEIDESGKYRKTLSSVTGLPPYCAVKLAHRTGTHTETITVWSPLYWNGRFIGTGGGGMATGGDFYITKPDNTQRGQTLPKAVCNGFTAATTDAANTKNEWAFDNETHTFDEERYENWRAGSTHFMTLAGKAVAEILHGRPVKYAYFHGGSGGGRQAMMEAQEYPNDYNGIWASCPAINWNKFTLLGLWLVALINNGGQVFSRHKLEHFLTAAQNSVGGQQAYYKRAERVEFDPFTLVGQKTKGGTITKADAEIMQQIWDGPRDESGKRVWYGFRPGVLFWNHIIPVGGMYYNLLGKPRPFAITTFFARWITKNPKQKFNHTTLPEFYEMFNRSVNEFSACAADNVYLTPFAAAGGKLIIDHGIDDPLIPVDGTIDYYKRLCAEMGGKTEADKFCRLYITPGDGHGSCNWHGPGITERDGMTALINWVENNAAPEELRVVQVGKKGETIREGVQTPYQTGG